MIFNMVTGEDSNINFKIIGSTTQPVSPKENTIWINTDIDIGEWQFSTVEPLTRIDGTLLQNGDVWLPILNVCKPTFNIYKKNGVPMAIAPCKLYIDGKWESCVESRYINNAWTPPTAILFDETYNVFHLTKTDDMLRAAMSGWNQTEYSELYSKFTFKITDDGYYRFSTTSNPNKLKVSHVYRYIPFDISNYNKMYVDVVKNGNYNDDEQPWVFNISSIAVVDDNLINNGNNSVYFYQNETGVKSANITLSKEVTDNAFLNVQGTAGTYGAGSVQDYVDVRSIWFTKEDN